MNTMHQTVLFIMILVAECLVALSDEASWQRNQQICPDQCETGCDCSMKAATTAYLHPSQHA